METLSVDGSKMNLNKIGHEDVDRINLAQDGDPISGCCEHGNERSESKQNKSFLTSRATTSFKDRILLCAISQSSSPRIFQQLTSQNSTCIYCLLVQLIIISSISILL